MTRNPANSLAFTAQTSPALETALDAFGKAIRRCDAAFKSMQQAGSGPKYDRARRKADDALVAVSEAERAALAAMEVLQVESADVRVFLDCQAVTR